MFGFLETMFETPEESKARKVQQDRGDNWFLSTVRVNDGEKPYETALGHDRYFRVKDHKCSSEGLFILEGYDTREEAQKGHEKWLAQVSTNTLPETLEDCYNSEVSQFLRGFLVYKYEKD